MEYIRKLDLPGLLAKKSFFLFGPRSTGKTYLIKQQLKDKVVLIDLLRAEILLRLTANPSELENIISAGSTRHPIIVIDEVQKIPELLNEVHRLIEENKEYKFLLTGSSARKLRKVGVDMLAGRAWTANLFPLTWSEIPEFKLDHHLRFGGLPEVNKSPEPEEELYSYVETYLREEIRAEGLIRNLPPFSRFLKAAALSNGNLINFTNIGNDCQVAPSTVREYYSVLEDTLIGFTLEPWMASKKRKAIQTGKFYFFDTGVTHTIAGTKNLDPNSNLYGNSFEQFIVSEVRAYLSYSRKKEPMTFWRSTNGFEVDLLVGDHSAIEIKATKRISNNDTKGIEALAEEKILKNLIIVSQDKILSKSKNITHIHWEEFLKRMWHNEIF